MVRLIVIIVVGLKLIIPGPSTAFICAGAGDPAEPPVALKRLGTSGLLASEPVSGTYEALVVFARFADDPPQVVPSWANNLFRPEVPGSVAHYYEEQSFGRLHLRGTILPQVYAATGPRSAYLAPDAAA